MRKTRILLVSDVHYTTEETAKQLKEKYPQSNASQANGPILGYTQKQRMDFLVQAVLKEHEKQPLDAILMPGDLSVDDYDFRNLPYNYCEKFRNEVMAKFPVPTYVQPGNHDSYTTEQWKTMFGTPRQFSAVIGGSLFLMADTYNAPTNGASGSPYTPFDIAWAKAEMARHPDLPVFITAHYIHWRREGEPFAAFLRENPRVKALFVGHSHRFETVRMGEAYNNRSMYDIGAFSYYTKPTNGKWDFNIFHQDWRWGYQLLEFDDKTFKTWHVSPAMTYHGHNGNFELFYDETVADEEPIT
ncbi:MAG: hypothetical protein E7585_00825 [Ruminococcaceae bacterium]|nr:hypothetical protein [Oscillospiraceae bacterium]